MTPPPRDESLVCGYLSATRTPSTWRKGVPTIKFESMAFAKPAGAAAWAVELALQAHSNGGPGAPAEGWLAAHAILSEREVFEDGASSTEYLVAFCGRSEPAWALEVSSDLLVPWYDSQPAQAQEALAAAIPASGFDGPSSAHARARAQSKYLLYLLSKLLKRGLRFSAKKKESVDRRHHIRAPFDGEVFGHVFPDQLASLLRSHTIDRVFSRSGFRFTLSSLRVQQAFARLGFPGWWTVSSSTAPCCNGLNFAHPVTLTFKIDNVTDFTHFDCPHCSGGPWSDLDYLGLAVPKCTATEILKVSNVGFLSMTFSTARAQTYPKPISPEAAHLATVVRTYLARLREQEAQPAEQDDQPAEPATQDDQSASVPAASPKGDTTARKRAATAPQRRRKLPLRQTRSRRSTK
eukprot:m.199519 g.199519  ORF g.199519 m.199519 type:complete len:407 (+) comp10100_c0_seq2:40-1260(+)